MSRVSRWLLILLLAVPPAARAQGGTPLGPEFRINTYTTSTQILPAVATDASGNFVVVWNSYGQDGSFAGVFGQRFGGSVPLGPEFRVNSYTPAYQNQASVAADSAGNFVVVWRSGPAYPFPGDVFGQRYASDGTPLGPEFRINTFVTGDQSSPDAAVDTSGNFVVVWDSFDGSYTGISGQRFAFSGAPLGPEFRVNTYTTGYQSVPFVAADSVGNFVVVWSGPRGPAGPGDVFGQRYASNGTPLGPEFRVNTYTTNDQRFPAVAADPAGNFVVVWGGEGQGDSQGVFGQRYASDGTPDGPEFRINTYTMLVQHGPAVGADPAGDFVVTWYGYGQDGSYSGIFGQRFGRIVPVELMHFSVE